MTAKTYSMVSTKITPTTGTGLDQLVEFLYADNGLAGNNSASGINTGATAANRMNQIILEAAVAKGALADGKFTVDEVLAMNAWIRSNRLTEWTALHGDDNGDTETGFHMVQNDGGNSQYRGNNLINTVEDGIYHLGFAVQNGHFLNEDGNENATVEQVTAWLNQFYTDHSTTNTSLDRITNLVMADAGLPTKIADTQIAAGADAANGLNKMLLDAVNATGVGMDGWITADDMRAINTWIRADANRLAQWTALHGDDDGKKETGFHNVQNDGGNTTMFGKNFINTVADGLYHAGFQIQGTNFVNEDGNTNASVTDVASWLNYFYADESTTGTGLDKIVDVIKTDAGLATNTSASDINEGARYADQLNHFIIDAINATGVMKDGWITEEDAKAMNAWIRADTNRLTTWTNLHGDDEDGEETGYHLVQNDGANTNYFGRNLVNTVADGIYHMGFAIQNGRFLNEDGNENQTVADVATWLNYFYKGTPLLDGTDGSETIDGSNSAEEIVGRGGNDTINAGGGDDLVEGGYGDDVINGGSGNDILIGGLGNDSLNGGENADTYQVTGNQAGGWQSFNGFDTYSDTGTSGVDTLKALGTGDVDIGLKKFDASSGIEVIDASGATGTVRLLGDYTNDTLDFRKTTLTGSNIVIDGGSGDDTLYGNALANTLVGSLGNDTLDGGEGADTYRVTGNQAGGWQSFNGFDTYSDTGTSGVDTLKALGTGDVDIGLKKFDASSGIEVIDASGATGTVRLLGDYTNDTLDFRKTTLTGSNIVIDGGSGDDTLYGNASANTLVGSLGNDVLDGGEGADTYRVTGNQAGGWQSFNGFDAYTDTGTSGIDTLKALGTGNVDIGLKKFDASSGIEVIDTSGATGTVRLLGDYTNDTLDFRKTTLTGSNIVIDGGSGNDILRGSIGNDKIMGGSGNDVLIGGLGADVLNGGDGSDLLLDNQNSSTKAELLIGGGDKDRIVLGHNDHSTVDIWGGTVDAKGDGSADSISLLNSKIGLALSALIHDFEHGKDKIDLTQLRDAGNKAMGLDDLTIATSNGNTVIGFVTGTHTAAGGAVDVNITLLNYTTILDATDFAFIDTQIPNTLPSIDPWLPYLIA